MVVNDIQKDDKDLTGSVFGRWTVQYLAPIRKDRRTTWHCLCECGKEHDVVERDLLSGKSLSCGCYAIERMNQAHTTHGDTNGEYKRLLTIWRNMIARCSNEHASSYQDYGGRGISVCDEWQDYPTFKEWALAHGYENDLTIERVDVNGNYGPDNCKWIPRAEQARNKRNTVRIHKTRSKHPDFLYIMFLHLPRKPSLLCLVWSEDAILHNHKRHPASCVFGNTI